jgi:hypothetical protein
MVKQRLMVDMQAAEETRQAEVHQWQHHQAEIEAPMAGPQHQVECERRSEDEARRMHKEKLLEAERHTEAEHRAELERIKSEGEARRKEERLKAEIEAQRLAEADHLEQLKMKRLADEARRWRKDARPRNNACLLN